MSPVYERERADLARMRKSEKLDGLRHTGRVLDNARDYQGKDRELKGITARIKRIESGQEKV